MDTRTTILIVDDDAFVRGVYAEKFKEAGFHVFEAQDGQEAYEFLERRAVDIVFTGIIMPRMTGFDLMEKLAQHKKLRVVPVVISSHRGKEEDRTRAHELGAKDFLVSGFVSPNEVVDRIQEIMKTSRSYEVEIKGDDKGMIALHRDFKNLTSKNSYRVRLIPKDTRGITFDAELLEE